MLYAMPYQNSHLSPDQEARDPGLGLTFTILAVQTRLFWLKKCRKGLKRSQTRVLQTTIARRNNPDVESSRGVSDGLLECDTALSQGVDRREKIMDGLASWLGPGKVSDILAAVKDRDLWRDMIANAYKQGDDDDL
ncbi:hypothetical protein PoB_001561900 [Plakobranchus ocellatus]|uniref:Uncharacterized protein n=1 Tax=Plakobranchus ocellatus TaxID=259542 RepID=A0AAV3Z1C8_9GAST|nr:hypothetical protein PoB_001561900 [Plakobranchus ocellatus]